MQATATVRTIRYPTDCRAKVDFQILIRVLKFFNVHLLVVIRTLTKLSTRGSHSVPTIGTHHIKQRDIEHTSNSHGCCIRDVMDDRDTAVYILEKVLTSFRSLPS